MEQGCEPRTHGSNISNTQPCHMMWGRTVAMNCLKTGENWGQPEDSGDMSGGSCLHLGSLSLLCECLANVLSVGVWKIVWWEKLDEVHYL